MGPAMFLGNKGQRDGAVKDSRLFECLGHLRHRRVRHGAVVRTVATAAGGQARFVIGSEGCHERPEPEENDKEDGHGAAHLKFML